MRREVQFNGQRDWRIARYVIGGIVGFAVLAQVLVYLSLVALVDRPYAAAMVGAALISLLMGVPLIVLAATQFRRAQRLRNQINHVVAHDATTGCVTGRGLVQQVNGLERRRQRAGEELHGALIHLRINNLDDVGAAFVRPGARNCSNSSPPPSAPRCGAMTSSLEPARQVLTCS